MSTSESISHRALIGRAIRTPYSNRHFVKNLDISHELHGHTGCVNALNWSSDGRYLASGSDDTKIIIWDSQAPAFEKGAIIHTGHTRNIFSVKFLPSSNNRTVLSAAGDKQIRVFDVEYGGSAPTVLEQPCARTVYRAHHDRVKRIAVEDDGHCFLSCSEDGDIRQFDLRENNADSEGFRAPLISYAKYQIDLNTISLNKVNPFLLATGGSHPCAFLHDRRMVGRDMRSEWGMIPTMSSPTQCVKKFKSPKTRSTFRGAHITALHFGNANPRELICSWSCDDVYLFDIHGETDQAASRGTSFNTGLNKGLVSTTQKRKRSSSPVSHELNIVDGSDALDLLLETRRYLLTPPFEECNYLQALDKFAEATSVALRRLSDEVDPNLVQHLSSCEELLKALAGLEYDHESELHPESIEPDSLCWQSAFIYSIIRSFSLLDSDPSNRIRLQDHGDSFNGPLMDITLLGSQPKQLFPSLEALVTSFNAIIATEETILRTHTTTGRNFWLHKVCRSLLASTKSLVDKVTRPVPASSSSQEDWSDENDDDGDDSDSGDSIFSGDSEDLQSDEAEEARNEEEYRDDLTSAIHKVSPGVPIGVPIRSFSGHVNVETVKDVNFFGLRDEFVMSGSDDGLLFIWDKLTGKIVTMLQGDSSVTNVMEGNPQYNSLAVSGIDETVKIFEPFEPGESVPASRKIAQPEYEVRARNEERARGDVDDSLQGVRIPRRVLIGLAGQMEQENDCRMQ